MTLFAKLDKRFRLCGWKKMPYALAERKEGKIIPLSRAAFYVLNSCDGNCDFDSLAFTSGHKKLLHELLQKKIAVSCKKGDMRLPWQAYHYADNRFIREIHWAVTGYCNLSCSHCFMESPSGKYGELDWERTKELADKMAEANVLCISLTGGEPLLRKDFKSLVRLLTKKGIYINELVTNGMLVDDDLLDFLKEQDQVGTFQVSFDGIGRHDEMRHQEGAEKRVLEAITEIRRRGYPVVVCSVFTKKNLSSLERTYFKMKELDIQLWMVSRPHKAGYWKGGEAALSTQEMGEACLKLQKLWLEDGRLIPISFENFYNGGSAADSSDWRFHQEYSAESLECPVTRNKLFLLPNGILMPCPGFAGTYLERDMPSLLELPFAAAVDDSYLDEFTGITKRERMEKINSCRGCEYRKECGAGCRAYALRENGTMMAVDPFSCARLRGGWGEKFSNAEQNYKGKKYFAKAKEKKSI